MSVQEKLMNVQIKLNAPKGQLNKYGNYRYRSCEDILEAVKPHLLENKATITITDEPIVIGDRYYIRATATFTDIEDGSSVSINAYAREPGEKKGSDASQITGASSSYARKYALNGLLLCDDSKDEDTAELHDEKENRAKGKAATKQEPKTEDDGMSEEEYNSLLALMKKKGVDENVLKASYKVESLITLSHAQYENAMRRLQKSADKES